MRARTLQSFPIFAASVLAASALTACQPQATNALVEVARPVKTMVVGSVSAAFGGSYSAEIRPRIESPLAFRVSGKLMERLVDIGTVVKKDQILMRLDPSDLQLSANAAQAQVAMAKANDDVAQAALKRAQELVKQNFISQSALDQTTGTANSTKAALVAAQANGSLGVHAMQYGVLRADADGVVTALSAEVGQVVAAGMPVLKVSVGGGKDVVFSVPEEVAGLIKRGSLLDVQLWAKAGLALTAHVRDVSIIADSLTRTFTIKASLNDQHGIASLGSTAAVSMTAKAISDKASTNNNSIMIPLASILETQGKMIVWVIEPAGNIGVAKKRMITLASNIPSVRGEAMVTVASGLTQGTLIATAGVHTLSEGQKVRLN